MGSRPLTEKSERVEDLRTDIDRLQEREKEILDAAGFFFDTSHGMKRYSDYYMTFSQIREFGPLIKQGLQRVAFVGTPCQIQAVRRMQTLNIIPADSIRFCLGLFCSGNFTFCNRLV